MRVSEEKDDERDLQSTFQQALSSEHTQSSEFTHVMLSYIVGERNLSPALPFGSCSHPLLVLKYKTPNIFLSTFPSLLRECQPALPPTSFRAGHDLAAQNSVIKSFRSMQLSKTCLISLLGFLIQLCRTTK